MKHRVIIISTVIVGIALMSGCALIPIRPRLGEVQELVGSRTGLRLHWSQGSVEDQAVSENIQGLLSEQLTAERAVQIALVENRSLQATFEELGIAQADLVQAGLLENPVFSSSVRFPDVAAEATNTEFAVVQNFLNILSLPLRKKIAAHEFAEAKFQVGDAVLNLAHEVKAAYYTLQGTMRLLTMQQTVVKAEAAAVKLAERQFEAGNINELDFVNQQTSFHQAALDLEEFETRLMADREHLQKLMGLAGTETDWRIVDELPELPQIEPPLEDLEVLALSKRLDLAALRAHRKMLKRTLSATRLGAIPGLIVDVGVNTEREPDRVQLTGPTFEVELPLFDQGQASIARVKAMLRQSQHRVAAKEREVQSEVRLARIQLLAERKAVESYRDTIIPLHQKTIILTQEQYNFMLHGVYELLLAKQDEIMARSKQIEALRDYWIAWSDLERAVGAWLGVLPKESTHDGGVS